MNNDLAAFRQQIARQVEHWSTAAARLSELENLAAPGAWAGLERYLGAAVRSSLGGAVLRLQRRAAELRHDLSVSRTETDLQRVQQGLVRLRWRYLRTETALDFYADAVNTRTSPEISAMLRACDAVAVSSMTAVLAPLGKPTPPVLCYLDKGLGASVLKAGLRLWDGSTENPAATIKIVWHNLFRPTALIHESGHQVAHILGWNAELANALRVGLAAEDASVAEIWGNWASEIAADGFAFVHTGYASVAALHDVLAGNLESVFRFDGYDPHPISYLRVLLGVEMCRRFFGQGPWDDLHRAWTYAHPLDQAAPGVRNIINRSLPLLPRVVDLVLLQPTRAFGGRSLSARVDPQRVHPDALARLERQAGPSLYTSHHWIRHEPLRLVALTGYKIAVHPDLAATAVAQQRSWTLRFGAELAAA